MNRHTMSAAKKQASKEEQNSNNQIQKVITKYFTPRENKHKQRRQIEDKPEVDGSRTVATCAFNKEKIVRDGGEDAGLLHHQAAPGHAPRQEPQPSTICLLTIPNCPNIEAPPERVHLNIQPRTTQHPLVQSFQTKHSTA